MYCIVSTKNYRKSYKKLLRSGREDDIKELEKIISLIAYDKKLDIKFKDHKLHGELSRFRECHIKPDLLLIYEKDKKNLILVLVDIGSHDDLF